MTANDYILDQIYSRAVDISRYDEYLRSQIIDMLGTLEQTLIADIAKFNPDDVRSVVAKQKRLEALLEQTQETIRLAYRDVNGTMRGELRDFAIDEGDFVKAMFDGATAGVAVDSVAISAEALKALATDTLIDGAVSKDWWSRQAGDVQFKFKGAMQEGFLKGEGVSALVDRVLQPKSAGGLGMEIARNNAEAIVRTSVMAVSSAARDEIYAENDDLLLCVVWLATLDNRTSEPCRARDGLKYNAATHEPIGHSLPWGNGPGRYHWNCRSTSVPVLRSAADLGLDDAGARRSMDGLVPKHTTYEQWLKTKPAAFQDDVLGKGKADLWREGRVKWRQLVDQQGNGLSLKEIKERRGA